MKKSILFFLSIFVILLCLFLEKNYWAWLYLDNRWLISYKFFWSDIFSEVLYSFNNWSYFWFDKSSTVWARLLNTIIASSINQYLLFFIFFLWSYVWFYYLLKLKYNSASSHLWALLFTFNPISIHFLNYTTFLFVYPSITTYLYWIIKYIKTNRIIFLFITGISFLFLISYIRATGIYLTLTLFTVLFFHRDIFNLVKYRKITLISWLLIWLLIWSTFFFWHIFWKINGDSKYFSWVANYAERNINFSDALYKKEQDDFFLLGFIPKEIINNFAKDYHESKVFEFYSLYFVFLILLIWVFFIKEKKPIYNYAIVIFLFSIFIRKAPFFLSNEVFGNFAFTYYPFIAWELKWIFLLTIPVFCFILAFSYANIKEKKVSNIIFYSTILYILISLVPIVNIWWNQKMGLINHNSIPKEYIDIFYDDFNIKEATLFYPDAYWYKDGNLLLEWSPYPLIINYNSNYNSLLNWNYRVVNDKQSQLWNKSNQDISQNLSILNLKNILLLKDAKNTNWINFDWYQNWKDIEKISNTFQETFNNTWSILSLYSEWDKINHYKLQEYANYEYFLYSPATITRSEIDTFFDSEIDINSRPIVIDSESFHKPEKIDNFEIPETNQNIRIDYKRSTRNPTKYFVKISDVDTTQDFLVQLNQTFGMSWKLKWIDADEYQRYSCLDNYEYFPITNNSFCYFEDGYLDSIWDYKYLDIPQVKEENHFEGNFVWNTWLVEPDDIRSEDSGKSELYAVVIYEKQFWYMLSLWISFGTLWLLILAAIAQEVYLYKKGRKRKIDIWKESV